MLVVAVARRLPIDPAELLPSGVRVVVFPEPRAPSREELVELAHGADALLTLLSERVDGALIDVCPRVRIVANYAVGFDNIAVAELTERSVWVTNTPDVLTDATADLTFALVLAAARRIGEGERLLRAGRFHGWDPTMLLGKELAGATLGLFGFGRIGRAVARRAHGFGMSVISCNRSPIVSNDAMVRQVEKAELLAEADVISVHCPLTSDTFHAFSDAEFQAMKRDAILINTARGPIVDERALARALENRMIAGAGLDVFEAEPHVHPGLLGREDVVLVPHLGSATETTRRRMAEIAIRNIARVLAGDVPPNAVNTIGSSARKKPCE